MDRSSLRDLQALLGWSFENIALLKQALTASVDAANRYHPEIQLESNRRLAMIGDRVLGLHIFVVQYEAHSCRATMDAEVRRLACNEALARVGYAKKLDRFVNRNPGDSGKVKKRTMADTVEAIIGAVYLDGGLDAAMVVMKRLGLE